MLSIFRTQWSLSSARACRPTNGLAEAGVAAPGPPGRPDPLEPWILESSTALRATYVSTLTSTLTRRLWCRALNPLTSSWRHRSSTCITEAPRTWMQETRFRWASDANVGWNNYFYCKCQILNQNLSNMWGTIPLEALLLHRCCWHHQGWRWWSH